MQLRQTYELYLDDGTGDLVFEALTCVEHELISKVRSLLAARSLSSVEVRQHGQVLMTLA